MLEDISGEQIKEQFKSNKKLRLVTMIVGGLIVLILGYFLYKQFVWKPANEKSKDSYWVGLNYATADSTEMAIDELRVQVKNNDGKIGGEVAQFVYARQLMAKGEFQKALDELEGVKVKDTYVSVMSIGLQGDCKSEMKKYEEAASLYMEAAELNENDLTSPMYIMKAALCAEELKSFEEAAELYQRISDDYPSFASQKSIERYITRAKNKTVKK
jgi:tetratricopeptide (TPR) repeat protein